MVCVKLLKFLTIFISSLLAGCVGPLWTGANLIYDRHHVYLQVDDFQLGAAANRALYCDQLFKYNDCALEVAVFHRDLLVVGRVPSVALRQEINKRLQQLPGIRRYYNAISVTSRSERSVSDAWITTKIRSRILADSTIDPQSFKIITFNGIVYVMGDVFPMQAHKVLTIINTTSGVVSVVKLLKYYRLE